MFHKAIWNSELVNQTHSCGMCSPGIHNILYIRYLPRFLEQCQTQIDNVLLLIDLAFLLQFKTCTSIVDSFHICNLGNSFSFARGNTIAIWSQEPKITCSTWFCVSFKLHILKKERKRKNHHNNLDFMNKPADPRFSVHRWKLIAYTILLKVIWEACISF